MSSKKILGDLVIKELIFFIIKKSCIRATPNHLTDADSSTDIYVSAGVKKGADSIFFGPSPFPAGGGGVAAVVAAIVAAVVAAVAAAAAVAAPIVAASQKSLPLP